MPHVRAMGLGFIGRTSPTWPKSSRFTSGWPRLYMKPMPLIVLISRIVPAELGEIHDASDRPPSRATTCARGDALAVVNVPCYARRAVPRASSERTATLRAERL
eukprot:3373687-Prymnesium_polylepis.1